MKQKNVKSEWVYLAAVIMLSFAVAMITATDFGVSMIVAPAFILSQKVSFLSFGQAEYVIQGILFLLLCGLLKKIKISYFFSFFTGLLYGACLDLWRLIIPHFNPNICPPGSLPIFIRCLYFAIGMVLTSLSVALFFKTYLYPQVYDFFVKSVSAAYHKNRTRFKQAFDIGCLLLSLLMTIFLFHRLVGIGWGTVIMTVCNGPLIGFFDTTFDRFFTVRPLFDKFAAHFE